MTSIVHIQHGAIVNRSTVRNAFADLKDGRYLMELKKSNTRSLNQNAYYHGIVVPLVKDGLRTAGYNDVRTNEDAHEVLKYLFLKKKIPNQHAEFVELIGSTASLTTVEFMEYIAAIQQWATEYLNITIPDPNQQLDFFPDSALLASHDNEVGATVIEKA